MATILLINIGLSSSSVFERYWPRGGRESVDEAPASVRGDACIDYALVMRVRSSSMAIRCACGPAWAKNFLKAGQR
jgi:hypothetical protein